MLDLSVADSQGSPLDQGLTLPLEGGHIEGFGKVEVRITQHIVGQVQTLLDLALVVRVLGAEAVDSGHAELLDGIKVVAIALGLGGAAAGPRHVVPFVGDSLTRGTGAGVAEQDGQSR